MRLRALDEAKESKGKGKDAHQQEITVDDAIRFFVERKPSRQKRSDTFS